MDKTQKYTVKVKEDYVYLVTQGKPDYDHLDAPVNAALRLAKEKKIDKLLDDIRDVDSSSAGIAMQSKSMGILWKMRSFKKVAIVVKDSRMQNLFFSTINVLRLSSDSRFKGFDTVEEAVAWLREP